MIFEFTLSMDISRKIHNSFKIVKTISKRDMKQNNKWNSNCTIKLVAVLPVVYAYITLYTKLLISGNEIKILILTFYKYYSSNKI